MNTEMIDMQDKCREFIGRKVYACASHLVYELAQETGLSPENEWYEDLLDLWQGPPSIGTLEGNCPECGDWIELEDEEPSAADEVLTCPECKHGILSDELVFEPTEWQEVFEHWIVDPGLAYKLEERGETVKKDFMGMAIWARCCTGQAIYMDSVIEDIVKEIER